MRCMVCGVRCAMCHRRLGFGRRQARCLMGTRGFGWVDKKPILFVPKNKIAVVRAVPESGQPPMGRGHVPSVYQSCFAFALPASESSSPPSSKSGTSKQKTENSRRSIRTCACAPHPPSHHDTHFPQEHPVDPVDPVNQPQSRTQPASQPTEPPYPLTHLTEAEAIVTRHPRNLSRKHRAIRGQHRVCCDML